MTSSPTSQWESRDSSGAVISSQWETEQDDVKFNNKVNKGLTFGVIQGSSGDGIWEESTAFRELSIAQGRFKVSRV